MSTGVQDVLPLLCCAEISDPNGVVVQLVKWMT